MGGSCLGTSELCCHAKADHGDPSTSDWRQRRQAPAVYWVPSPASAGRRGRTGKGSLPMRAGARLYTPAISHPDIPYQVGYAGVGLREMGRCGEGKWDAVICVKIEAPL